MAEREGYWVEIEPDLWHRAYAVVVAAQRQAPVSVERAANVALRSWLEEVESVG
jgi:hypothetical protein